MLYKSNERKVFRPIVFQTKQLDIIKILPSRVCGAWHGNIYGDLLM